MRWKWSYSRSVVKIDEWRSRFRTWYKRSSSSARSIRQATLCRSVCDETASADRPTLVTVGTDLRAACGPLDDVVAAINEETH